MFRTLVVLVALFSAEAFADKAIPSDYYAMPSAGDLQGHEWSYRQGLDFDVINYRGNGNPGISFYMGVGPSQSVPVENDGTVNATILGKPVKLYKKCNRDGENCRYTNLLDTGVVVKGNKIWTRVWVAPKDKGDLKKQLEWLTSLKFSPYNGPQAAGVQ